MTLVEYVGSNSLSHTTHCFCANAVRAILWRDAIFQLTLCTANLCFLQHCSYSGALLIFSL